jgi:hypothetical protein
MNNVMCFIYLAHDSTQTITNCPAVVPPLLTCSQTASQQPTIKMVCTVDSEQKTELDFKRLKERSCGEYSELEGI